MKSYGNLLFKDTAAYYSLYRPMYPAALFRFLVSRFGLDGSGRMLDIGCGTGRLTLRFADWFEELHGMDAEAEMIAEADRLSREMRIENASWNVGHAPEFPSSWKANDYRMVIMASSFHWMDRDRTLEALFPLIRTGGGIAIVDSYDPDNIKLPWEEAVQQVIRKWLGEQRRAGDTTYTHPDERHETVVNRSRFRMEKHRLPDYNIHWTVETLVGYLYSTSYASRRLLGDKTEAFEADLKGALLSVEPSGTFTKPSALSVILAMKE